MENTCSVQEREEDDIRNLLNIIYHYCYRGRDLLEVGEADRPVPVHVVQAEDPVQLLGEAAAAQQRQRATELLQHTIQ